MSNDRYLRHLMIDWFDQEAIAKASVVVVGAGATGNEVLKNLSLLGVGRIHIIDYDRIETHNLTRTILFTDSDIDRYKAEVAADACHRIDPLAHTSYSTEDFWKSLTIEKLRNYDALFCCVDNFDARIKLNKLCLISRVDFYNTAIDSRSVVVERYPFGTDLNCACYECDLPLSVYGRMRERYSCGWLRKRAFQEQKIPTTIVTASIAGAEACSLYLHRSHRSSLRGAIRCYTDTITLQSAVSLIQRNDDCLTCSGIGKEIQYFKARKGPHLPDILTGCKSDDDVVAWLSDKVIVDLVCKECGHRRLVNDLVDKYDETLLHCDQCGMDSNAVAVKDFMTLHELKDASSISQMPLKYLNP